MPKAKLKANHSPTGLMKAWKKIFTYRKFFLTCMICLGITCAVIPPALVVYHRWLNQIGLVNFFYYIWSYLPFVKQLLFPTYFLLIFLVFIQSTYCFTLLAIIDKAKSPLLTTETGIEQKPTINISVWQKFASTCLLIIGGIWSVIAATVTLIQRTIPGIGWLGIPFLFVMGLILNEVRLSQIRNFLTRHAGWIIAYTAIYSSVLVLLQILFNEKEYQFGAGALLVMIVAAIMIRWYKSVPPFLWISLGALVLYAWAINPWHFNMFGDEFEFYNWAAYILSRPLSEVSNQIFRATAAHTTHPYLVSLFQAGFMKLFGVSNFGWRISNPIILSAAVACFYLFFRKFTRQSTALMIASMLACSSYLINFGKFGYDNPQAFFMLGLTLWLAAEAVFSRRPVIYALLGTAMGFCLYSYPAALYILPLPVLFLALFDPPKNKPAVWRWACWIVMAGIIALPLLVQPLYFETKLGGLFLNYPDAIARIGLPYIFSSNLVYSFFSYIYVVCETHFIASSHIDPISALWIPAGMACLLAQLRRNKFAQFWSMSFLIMWFLVGASHGREYPPDTRMFMLLPWWFSFAAFGITWLADWIGRKTKSTVGEKTISIALLVIILAANLVQVYWLVPRRFTNQVSMETLFLRLAERGDRDPGNSKPEYLFVTDEHWLIDRIQMMQTIYNTPQSISQLDRLVLVDETLKPDQLARLQAPDTIVIPQPWMISSRLESLTAFMKQTGKMACPVQETPDTQVLFTAYFPPNLAYLCPLAGNWNE